MLINESLDVPHNINNQQTKTSVTFLYRFSKLLRELYGRQCWLFWLMLQSYRKFTRLIFLHLVLLLSKMMISFSSDLFGLAAMSNWGSTSIKHIETVTKNKHSLGFLCLIVFDTPENRQFKFEAIVQSLFTESIIEIIR